MKNFKRCFSEYKQAISLMLILHGVSHYMVPFLKVIMTTGEVITGTLKVISATTKVILTTEEMITTTLKVISAITKVLLAPKVVTTATLKMI